MSSGHVALMEGKKKDAEVLPATNLFIAPAYWGGGTIKVGGEKKKKEKERKK